MGDGLNDGCLVADTRIRSHRDLRHTVSLLVAQHGEIVFERYHSRSGPGDLQSLPSVTKSVISTLVGIPATPAAAGIDIMPGTLALAGRVLYWTQGTPKAALLP